LTHYGIPNGHPIYDPGDHVPVTYHVTLAPELSRMLEVFAAGTRQKPETILAEAIRAYLGVDA
jgi:hypothetical protein